MARGYLAARVRGVLRGQSALRAAAALVAAQAVGVFGLAVFYVIELLVASSTSRGGAAVSAVLVLLTAFGLLLCAKGLREGRRWARSPVLVLEVIAVPVAIGLLQGGRWYVGGPILVWAVAVTGLMFAPGTGAVLTGRNQDA
jgi:hypothetical protein